MKSEFSLRKLMLSLIFGFILCLFFLTVEIISAAPLLYIMTRGVFVEDPNVVISNIYGNYISSEPVTIAAICIEIVLALFAIVSIFVFLRKIINLVFQNEKYIKNAYTIFYVIALIIPNALVLLCTLLNFSILPLLIVTGVLSLVIFVFSVVVVKKMIPDTNVAEFRKHLFEDGKNQ